MPKKPTLMFKICQKDLVGFSMCSAVAYLNDRGESAFLFAWTRSQRRLSCLILSGQTEIAGRSVHDSSADGQRRCGRWRRNVEHVQYFARWHELKIVNHRSIGFESLRSYS